MVVKFTHALYNNSDTDTDTVILFNNDDNYNILQTCENSLF